MALHWYPGHMHKANKEMAEILPQVDLIIELLDARLPYSSENPAIKQLRKNKPCIKILSKSDLADPSITTLWQSYYEQEASVKTLVTNLLQTDKAKMVTDLCHKLVPGKANSPKDILAMITGIPNVGKSTLINALAGRTVAKTGNEPAITKGQQRIKLQGGITLLDTPGILWPKIHNENSSYRLASTGAIKSTAMDSGDVAFFAVGYLLEQYPERLKERYQMETLAHSEIESVEQLGAKRGCLRSGGQVDFEKVSALLLNELRSGKLGQISLETPAMAETEKAAVEIMLAEKAALKEQKEKLKKKKRSNRRRQ